MTLKKILYVEQNTDGTVGGSHFSLLYLLHGLHKDLYSPVVLFYQENRLIPRFEKAGCKILILTKRKPLNLLKSFPQIKKLSKYRLPRICIVTPLLIFQKVINYFITFIFPSLTCWKILRRENISLVHLNNTLLRPQQWILASIFSPAKIIAHERGINTWFPSQSRFWARFLKAIICISDAVKTNLLKQGFAEQKLYRIYNGLDPNAMAITRKKEGVLEEFGIENGHPIVGIVGNIRAWKGQDTVIRSIKSVRTIFPGVRCLIIGGVADRDKGYLLSLENLVAREGLHDCIIFTGQRTDIPDLINILDILIHASIEAEPFGRVLLEGMALGKPLIATNIGAAPEIVEDGKTGLLVSPGDEISLAKAIISLLEDPQRARKMGKAGRIRVEKHFHLCDNVRETEKLYHRILTRK